MANYKEGEFCWYELGTRDIARALDFYTKLFEWETRFHDMGEMGKYYIFQLDGQDAGGGFQMSAEQCGGAPPHWAVYLWVDDVDASAAKAAELGGKVVAPPMDIPNVGRMAFIQDPQGAHLALFSGREHQGAARLSPKPGAFAWTELMTTDVEGARKFYSGLVGWTSQDMPMGPEMTYTVFQVDGKGSAGMFRLHGPQMEGVPPNWTSYVSVSNCDATVARAQNLGGTVVVPPQDVPGTGRFAVLQDPTGAVFAVIALQPM